MKYTVDGFRPLYHNFCIFPLEGNIKRAAHSIPGFEGADGVLAYGYCDDKTGFTIDIMCCVKKAGERTYAICSFSSWIWSVVLIVLRCVLAPAYWVAEGVCDGSGWAWCVGLAVEAIFVSFIVGAISRILKK